MFPEIKITKTTNKLIFKTISKKMKHFLLIIFAALVLSSCSQQPQAETKTKALVLYYSQFSATKTLADSIAQKIGAENDYPADFGQTIARCQEDKANGTLPQLKPINANIADYDIVFLGYPIWFGTYAPPIEALLKQVDFSGKDVVPFCTFGSGGLTESVRDLKAAVPSINIKARQLSDALIFCSSHSSLKS